MEVIKEFANRTSIHGLAYLTDSQGILRKIFWTLVILPLFIIGMYNLIDGYNDFRNLSITTINSTTRPLRDIYFPSVYACNINQVTLTSMAEMGLDMQKDRELMTELFSSYVKGNSSLYSETGTGYENDLSNQAFLESLMTKIGWNETENFAALASQKETDTLLMVNWKSKYESFFFNSFLALTDFGACPLIYPYLDFEYGPTKDSQDRQYNGSIINLMHYGVRNGIKEGLQLMLDAEVFDYAYFFRYSSGFMVALADNRDKAIIKQKGFYVRPGTVNLVSIGAEAMVTTDEALSRFDPDQRSCYANDEFPFKYLTKPNGYRYSIDNCLYESVLNKVLTKCKCIPFFVSFKLEENLPKCRNYGLACARYYLENIGNDNMNMDLAPNNQGELLKCYQSCSFQSEKITVTTADYPNHNTFENRNEMCVVLHKLHKICQNQVKLKIFLDYYKSHPNFPKQQNFCALVKAQINDEVCQENYKVNPLKSVNDDLYHFLLAYTKENIVKTYIYFKEPFHTQIVKDVSVTFISFLGNSGGLLGLCTGMSLLSLFEILYYLFNLIIYLCTTRH